MKVVILAGGFGTRISEESHLKPKPMIEIGEKPILWHIIFQFVDSRITTGIVEGLNSKIKTAMERAYGFKSFEYLRTVIYLAAGKMDRCPAIF